MMDFDGFFESHYAEVVRTLALAVGDRGRAEDAAQEAFATALRRWPEVSRMERPVGWVVVVGTRRLRRWITRHDRRFTLPPPEPVPAPDPGETVVTGAALRRALDDLAPRQRAVVVLRYLCDLPTAEVAAALGCAEGTVKSSLSSALANLRIQLDDRTGDDPNATEEVARHAR